MKLLHFNNISEQYRKRVSRRKQLDPILSAEEILEPNRKALNSIFLSTGIDDDHFIALYRYPIERTAELLQLMPGPERGRHTRPGGMMAHILEACSIALKYRRNVSLPIGAPPEERQKKKDLYTYAVFAAALVQHVGGALYGQRPALYDWRGNHLCQWNPLLEGIEGHKNARFMKTGSGKPLLHEHRPMESLIYLVRILSQDGLMWLRADREVYEKFLDALSDAPRGPIHELVRKAYRAAEDGESPGAKGTRPQGVTERSVDIDTGNGQLKQADAGAIPSMPIREIRPPESKSRAAIPKRKNQPAPAPEAAAVSDKDAVPDIWESEELLSEGEKFRSWLEDQINESRLRMNEEDSLVYSTVQGIFVVAPDIFQVFATECFSKSGTAQGEFVNLGIHLKNPDNDNQNLWKARIDRYGGKTFKAGLLVPAGNLYLKSPPPPTEKLKLLEKPRP